jgi:hypothetical protein
MKSIYIRLTVAGVFVPLMIAACSARQQGAPATSCPSAPTRTDNLEKNAMTQENRMQAAQGAIPPIDVAAPVKVETATFALG